MNIQTFKPSLALAPFIKKYLIIESGEELVNRVLPETSLVMAFRFRGNVSYLNDNAQNQLPVSVLSGLRKSGQLISYSKNAANVLVIFKETGAAAFFREPLHELHGISVSLDHFTGFRNISELEEQLAEANDHAQRMQLVEHFLQSKIAYSKPDALILAAVDRIRIANGVVRIKELADALFISQDAFEKRFRRIAGVSPKQFSYIVRMQSIVNGGLTKQTLADTAFQAGYFDQPHFNKDFKLFTGQTPSEFLKSPVQW
ncbi:helix-turn-helix transcriptional regulator [Dyadobacter pollutisoli]|uniref:Helix-turn-helix transcriptional regulator n=1 Tax=Dyadobacter pollutisoli TaxID=2910158 RepID=A0A9E8SNI3_9BACT|nr:helix-turn-helix transcriptional regulator [Dyadobacter pollutisoli]WAC15288.1 helix-turn-helix transcriptional regulator [Dyadobacter pollutisoli]